MAATSDIYRVLTDPSPAYLAKMVHLIPKAEVVEREAWILARATDRVVLDVGAIGPLHAALHSVAQRLYGIDRQSLSPSIIGFDLDDVAEPALPAFNQVELVICGEILEHLSNPGWFLARLRRQYPVETIITVPNAFCANGYREIQYGREVINRDHVAWYSHTTMTELLRRVGYRVEYWAWYRGRPLVAEGLVFLVR